jgi:hypothetical protein
MSQFLFALILSRMVSTWQWGKTSLFHCKLVSMRSASFRQILNQIPTCIVTSHRCVFLCLLPRSLMALCITGQWDRVEVWLLGPVLSSGPQWQSVEMSFFYLVCWHAQLGTWLKAPGDLPAPASCLSSADSVDMKLNSGSLSFGLERPSVPQALNSQPPLHS